MLGVWPGAAWAVEPVRLVHGEETVSLLYDRHLAANGISHRLQSAPPRCSSLVFADACDIVFAHWALHSRRDVAESNFGSNRCFPSKIVGGHRERTRPLQVK